MRISLLFNFRISLFQFINYILKTIIVTVNSDLEMTGQFDWMDLDTDENEHSIEMHLPYIAKVMEK